MADAEKYEILVLGSGEAGKWTAWTMADEGRRTAMVERKWLGGSCPNIACLPSKNVIYSARVASLARRGAEFGLEMDQLRINMAGVRQRKRKMVEEEHQFHAKRTADAGIDLIMGEGRFVAPRTIEVRLNDGGVRRIAGERVFLDLGSRSTMPNVPGLAAASPMTHIEALDLDRLPRHLVVIGGGYIGLELAQAVRRFGSEVTVIEQGAQLAEREDPDVGAALLDLFHDEGIEVLLGTSVTKVEGHSGTEVRIYAKDGPGERIVEGTDLLVSVGRTPNTKGIGLEQVGVELDERGYIKVNERLETTASNVWAMGDCAGSPQFTHVAYHDFRVVRDNLKGGNRSTKDRIVPFCMFTDPELARVGRNETEAKRDKIEYRVAKLPMVNVLRTHTIAEPRGFMKMLIGNDSDEILGFTAFGIEASELMAAVQTAMVGRLPYTALRDAIFAHPTMSEGLVYLLGQVESAKG
ncbi:dihydrolipoyl dehydrogenase family protein [Candidatus Binatus sp.]|uniref:dihydrolipoyl dehydrogenase family protein n=1 Tax=Candidatus Binatus sp. TaxID=2811406 RepID=UPI003CB5F114